MNPISASENLVLFDKMRKKAVDATEEAVICVKDMVEDDDFSTYGTLNLEKIEYSKHILSENTMPLSLMASFQCGKSTTTSAMADGHEVTPCGKGGGGIKVSPIPVTVYENAYTTEIVIYPYSNESLVQYIMECCTSQLEDTNVQNYDLDDVGSRNKLIDAVKLEIVSYQNTKDYSDDRRSVLRDAILILSFYGSNTHQKIRQGKFKTLADIQPFLAFPTDLEERWGYLREYGFDITHKQGKDGKALFDELSSAYVFIDRIDIPVHSEFMGETGTAIIDAPGYMANNRDTERALSAANSAAVVLFLLEGKKQLSVDDKKMLCSLRDAGMSEKVLFVVNFKTNPEYIKQHIEGTILAQVKELGYTEKHHENLLYYNAFLAQRAAQGQLLLEGKMDNLTASSIILDAEERFPGRRYLKVEDAWKATTRKVLQVIDADDTADKLSDLGLCKETVDLISAESRWKEMITGLREHVMNSRAAGVLRDLGVKPVLDSIESIDRALAEREKEATENRKTLEQEYQNAKELLDKFSNEVKDVVSIQLPQSTDERLAENYYDEVVVGAIKSVAKSSTPEVFKLTGLTGPIGKKRERKIAETIKEHYTNEMTLRAHAWSKNLETSSVYIDNIKAKVLYIQRELQKTWRALQIDENELLSLTIPFPTDLSGLLSDDAVSDSVRDVVRNTPVFTGAQMEISQFLKSFGAGIGALFGFTFVYVYLLPFDFIIPGFAEIALALSSVVTAVVYAFSSKQKDKAIAKMEEKIENDLIVSITKEKKSIVDSIIRGDVQKKPPVPGVSSIRSFYANLFQAVVDKQKSELERVYQEKLDNLEKSEEERRRIARKAAEWREQRIEPLRKKMSGILAEINEIWG